MYVEHDVFKSPSDANIGIWRYVDLPKLVSLLTSRTLWFARANELSDRHEGAVGRRTSEIRQAQLEAHPWPAHVPPERVKEIKESQGPTARTQTRFTYINCWHMNESESVAMWKAYANSGSPVAIKSSFARLRDSFIGDERCYVGKVQYVDPDIDEMPLGNSMTPFTYKREAFAYERELRAVTTFLPLVPNPPREAYNAPPDYAKPKFSTIDYSLPSPRGLNVEVDLDRLVEAVYVGPDQLPWFHDAIARVVEAFAPSVEVRASILDTDPIF